MVWSPIISYIFSIVYYILYIGIIAGTITIVVLDNRNPVKTIAWILILLLFPYLGLILYFFFGRSTRHERVIGKNRYDRLMKRPMNEFLLQEAFKLPADQYKVAQLFRNTNQALPFEGPFDRIAYDSVIIACKVRSSFQAPAISCHSFSLIPEDIVPFPTKRV